MNSDKETQTQKTKPQFLIVVDSAFLFFHAYTLSYVLKST